MASLSQNDFCLVTENRSISEYYSSVVVVAPFSLYQYGIQWDITEYDYKSLCDYIFTYHLYYIFTLKQV